MTNSENIESLRGTDVAVWTKTSKSVITLLAIITAQYCLAFITSPLIARFLGPDGRGRFTFFLSVTQWAIVIFGLGSPQAITYLVASQRFHRSKAFSVALTVLITLAVAISALTLLLFSLWPTLLNYLTRPEVALLALCSFATLSLVVLSALLLGLQRSTDYYFFQLLTQVLYFTALITLLLTGHFTYFPLIVAYTAVTIFSCIIVAAWIIKQIGFQSSVRLNFWRPVLGYGLKIYPGSILSMVIIRMDVFFVTAFLGFTSLGYYAISVQMAEVIYQFACVFATLRLPHTASRSKAEADLSFPVVSRQLILLSFLTAILIAAGGITLIYVWLPNFKPSMAALLLLMPGTISLGLANLYFAELGGRGRAGYGSTIIALNSVVMVLLDLWLIPAWGINGAAISSSIVYTLGFSFALVAMHRESGISFRDLILIGPKDLRMYRSLVVDLKSIFQTASSRT